MDFARLGAGCIMNTTRISMEIKECFASYSSWRVPKLPGKLDRLHVRVCTGDVFWHFKVLYSCLRHESRHFECYYKSTTCRVIARDSRSISQVANRPNALFFRNCNSPTTFSSINWLVSRSWDFVNFRDLAPITLIRYTWLTLTRKLKRFAISLVSLKIMEQNRKKTHGCKSLHTICPIAYYWSK